MDYNDWYRANRTWLCEHTPNLPDFMRHLRAVPLLTGDKQAEIEACPGHVRRCEVLYDHLIMFGVPKIGDIIQCLEESDQPHVADRFRFVLISRQQESAAAVSVPSSQNPVIPPELDLDRNQLLRIRRLVVHDDEAIEKWPTIVEHIVQSGADKGRILHLINKDRNYKGAIFKTLRLWEGYGSERTDLLKVLRDEGLHRLADKIGRQIIY